MPLPASVCKCRKCGRTDGCVPMHLPSSLSSHPLLLLMPRITRSSLPATVRQSACNNTERDRQRAKCFHERAKKKRGSLKMGIVLNANKRQKNKKLMSFLRAVNFSSLSFEFASSRSYDSFSHSLAARNLHSMNRFPFPLKKQRRRHFTGGRR